MPIATTIDSQVVKTWLAAAQTDIAAKADYLTQLDSAIGDGDHGTNMRRGFEAVGTAVGQANGLPPGRILIEAGKTLVATVGGASGPLWGSGLRRAGRSLGEAESFDATALAVALDEMVAGIKELGAAEAGDATMLDALIPAARALHQGAGAGLHTAVRSAASAAQAGAEATIPLQARKGRASYLGPRSIGHQDPGATSAAIIMASLGRALSGIV